MNRPDPTTARDDTSLRQAASLLLLRDGPQGVEVLMLRRAERDNDLRSGAAVFPGGVLEAEDREAHRYVMGATDAALSERFGQPSGLLDFAVAAVRETFEEVGVLLACDDLGRHAEPQPSWNEWRAKLQRREATLAQMCEALNLRLDLRKLDAWSHWLTPPGVPKRFDTRFFVAPMPLTQEAEPDRAEALELMWLTARQALEPARALKLLPVTRRTLVDLGSFGTVLEVLAFAATQATIGRTLPRRALSRRGPTVVLPDELAYAEVCRLDPDGLRHDAWCDLVPGQPVWLSPRVLRITAPNPGMMTGPGTNSYFVGDPQARQWALIDPGPADEQHLQALRTHAPGPVAWILCTHSHVDHSPAAAALAASLGAQVLGRRPSHPQGQDPSFQPSREPMHGERLMMGRETTLRALHTPGHASNHLCWLLEEEKLLFTGDHVMSGSTVVINPPDGDMGAYLRSLDALLREDLAWLAPGHGFLVDKPHEVVRALVAHRLRREQRVLEAVRARGSATLDELLPEVYADTPTRLHTVARRSLLAHVLKLQDEGRVRAEGEAWVFNAA